MSTSAVDRVLAAVDVQFAYLFGSRTTGRHRPTSDADITIMPGRPLDLLARGSRPGRVASEVRTRSEYFDFLPTQRAHRDHFLRRVAARGLDG
jgi:predicted nucleotidyltransferase